MNLLLSKNIINNNVKSYLKNIYNAILTTCEDMDKNKGKILGKGATSTVYKFCILSDCVYAARYQMYDDYEWNQSLAIMEKTNVVANMGYTANIYAIFKCYDHIVTLTDYISGFTFREIIVNELESDKNPDIKITLDKKYMKKFVKIIGFIHSKRLYHGDLNMDNIMITNVGDIKLIDFEVREETYKPVYDYGTVFYKIHTYNKYFDNKKFQRIMEEFSTLLVNKMVEEDPNNSQVKRFENILKMYNDKQLEFNIFISGMGDII